MIDNPTIRARSVLITLLTVLGCALMQGRAWAQLPRLTTTLYADVRGAGAFVQDPSTPSIQYVVSELGRTVVIRVIQNGRLLAAPFLDLSGAVRDSGLPAQVGLAFPKDYGASGRFYVSFPNPAGHLVLSRFKRSTIEPLVADASSRFDVRWPGGQPFIPSPCAPCGNDYGAPVVIGADGYLYLATHGVSREANNPDQPAQNPSSLLGKVLRIDVSVADSDPEGYDIPADNPFVGRPGYLAEIWSFGWRNPRHLSLDDPALGGSGGLTIREVIRFFSTDEINFEPAGRGGRNYGWPTREGFSNTTASVPPAFLPLTDPVHAFRASEVSGGVGGGIYRGTALGPAYRGRYFYADWFNGTVTSIALTIDPGTGEASASNLENHSSDLRRVGAVSAFGFDAAGEMYVSSLSFEGVYRIDLHAGPRPLMHIDLPAPRAVVTQPFAITGWALDLDDSGAFRGSGTAGISTIHVWAYPNPGSGAPPRFVGVPAFGPRSDLSFVFGHWFGFSNPGFGLIVSELPPGPYRFQVFGWVDAIGTFGVVRTVDVTIVPSTQLVIDLPQSLSPVLQPFHLAGWAADTGALSGTGIDTIHVWAFPVGGGAPQFIAVPQLGGGRPDVAAHLGNVRFTPTGYNMLVSGLTPGTYDLGVYAHSTVTRDFSAAQFVTVVVQ